GRAGQRVIAARSLEDAAAVVDDMRADVDGGVLPVHKRPVHPDFARTRKSHWRLLPEDLIRLHQNRRIWRLRDTKARRPETVLCHLRDLRVSVVGDGYWASPQNGH